MVAIVPPDEGCEELDGEGVTDEEWNKNENENIVDINDIHILISWRSLESAIGVKTFKKCNITPYN